MYYVPLMFGQRSEVEAFNLPVVSRGGGPCGGPSHSRRLKAKTMYLVQGGRVAQNMDDGSWFGPTVARLTGRERRAAMHAMRCLNNN